MASLLKKKPANQKSKQKNKVNSSDEEDNDSNVKIVEQTKAKTVQVKAPVTNMGEIFTELKSQQTQEEVVQVEQVQEQIKEEPIKKAWVPEFVKELTGQKDPDGFTLKEEDFVPLGQESVGVQKPKSQTFKPVPKSAVELEKENQLRKIEEENQRKRENQIRELSGQEKLETVMPALKFQNSNLQGEVQEKFLPLQVVDDKKLDEPKRVYSQPFGSKIAQEEVNSKFAASNQKIEEPPFSKFVNSKVQDSNQEKFLPIQIDSKFVDKNEKLDEKKETKSISETSNPENKFKSFNNNFKFNENSIKSSEINDNKIKSETTENKIKSSNYSFNKTENAQENKTSTFSGFISRSSNNNSNATNTIPVNSKFEKIADQNTQDPPFKFFNSQNASKNNSENIAQ